MSRVKTRNKSFAKLYFSKQVCFLSVVSFSISLRQIRFFWSSPMFCAFIPMCKCKVTSEDCADDYCDNESLSRKNFQNILMMMILCIDYCWNFRHSFQHLFTNSDFWQHFLFSLIELLGYEWWIKSCFVIHLFCKVTEGLIFLLYQELFLSRKDLYLLKDEKTKGIKKTNHSKFRIEKKIFRTKWLRKFCCLEWTLIGFRKHKPCLRTVNKAKNVGKVC